MPFLVDIFTDFTPMSVIDQIKRIESEIQPQARLIAVTKTKPVSLIMEAYEAGARDFGENKVQEMVAKQAEMPSDIRWHQIGHLQTNKVKYIAPFVHLIHSVDSLKLLKEINKQAANNKRVIDCLLQVYIAREETKFGLSKEEVLALLSSQEFASFQNVRIVGLMGMASNTDDEAIVRREFASLKTLFEELKPIKHPLVDWKEISMGMSGDYTIAVEEGSTLVRVGSSIFGAR